MTVEALSVASKMTPAKPSGKQTADEKFEFYQGKGGHVFFRRKFASATNQSNSGGHDNRLAERNDGHGFAADFGSAASSKEMKFKPIRFGSGKKAGNFSSTSRYLLRLLQF